MPILKYSQLAKCLECNNASVSMAIRNEKLIVVKGTKTVDTEELINKVWIEKMCDKKGISFDLNKINEDTGKPKVIAIPKQHKKKKLVKKKEVKEENEDSHQEVVVVEMTPLQQLTYDTKKEELKRKKGQVRLDKIKADKEEGVLVPYDAMIKVFLYAAETFFSTYKQETKSMANILVERFGGTHDQFIEVQKDIDICVKSITSDLKENLIAGAEGIKEEFKVANKK